MKIISYNVNGIRAAIKKDLVGWLQEESPEIFCVQETKAHPDQLDLADFEKLGYQSYWHSAEKKGYSGVATFSKIKPNHVECGIGLEDYDKEGRFVRLDFDKFSLLNVYIPSGTSGQDRQDFKMIFLKDFYNYIRKLKEKLPALIICGDFNIANHPIDIHNPISNKNSSGFLPDEREWLTNFYDNGFFDVFRHFNREPHNYTWWTYRANARSNNKGWRIDYFAATDNLKNNIDNSSIHRGIVHSDHCPISLLLNT